MGGIKKLFPFNLFPGGHYHVMFLRAKDFGGGLFSLAASVMTDLIHHDPLCFGTLDEAGLPQAFLAVWSLLFFFTDRFLSTKVLSARSARAQGYRVG